LLNMFKLIVKWGKSHWCAWTLAIGSSFAVQDKCHKQIHLQQSNNRAKKQQLIPKCEKNMSWLLTLKNAQQKNIGFKMSLCTSMQKSKKNMGNF
jgi:hypothetical protein